MQRKLARAAMLVVICLAATQVVSSAPACAWGAAGHSTVAEIAERRLSPRTRRIVSTILGDVSLASVANFADTYSALQPSTRRWHFVNIPIGATRYDAARDCVAQAHGDCALGAIERLTNTLANVHAPLADRATALKLLVHLVADIHQPLHCAERDGDAGGSLLKVDFQGVPMSLHNVWDFALLDKSTFDWGEHVRKVAAGIGTLDQKATARGAPADWAWESHQLAVSIAYDLPADLRLDDAYQARALATIHQQLGKAAIRLTLLLTRALDPRSFGR